MKKELPFVYPPIIDSFSGNAGVIGIMMLNSDYKSLIVSNNFLISYDLQINAAGFNWAYYDDSYNIEADIRDEVNEYGIITTIENAINREYYVHLYLNHQYIKKSDAYNREWYVHDCATVIGYDSEQEVMLVADNFKNGKYSIEKVGYDEIIDARKDITHFKCDLLQVKKEVNHVLSQNEMVILLKSYRDGKCYLSEKKINLENARRINFSKILYGIEIYNVLLTAVSNLKRGLFDIRTFHVLYNHMSLYLFILDIFNINDSELCEEKVKQLMNNSKMLSLLYLKMKVNGSFKQEENLKERICRLRAEEMDLLDKLIKLLL